MMDLVGRWKVVDGTFEGLEYEFRDDGSFEMKMAEFAVEKALSDERTPQPPDFRALMLR